MNKRSVILLCLAILLLGIFVLGVLLFERNLAQKEQNLHATATVYIPPTTTAPPTTQPTEPPVVTAPEFIISDKDGRTFGVLNFKGKPTVLCFWTSDAEEELDLMQTFYDLYAEQAHFVIIHLTGEEETKEDALAFLETKTYTFPVYFDTMGTAATAYQVNTSPTTFFMTKDTVLKARAKGPLDPAKLPKALQDIGINYIEEPEVGTIPSA